MPTAFLHSESFNTEEKDEQWVVHISAEIEGGKASSLSISSPSIFMASSPLRGLKHEDFIPQVVAIGPYHSDLGPHHSSFPDNKETVRYKLIAAKEMEKHKVVACRCVVAKASPHAGREGGGSSFESLMQGFLTEIDRVRCEYDVELSHKNDKRLALMLALDACFVVEVLRSNAMPSPDQTSSHNTFQGGSQTTTTSNSLHPSFHSYYCSRFPLPLRKSVLQDLVLLENQMPLFLLTKIISMDNSSEVGVLGLWIKRVADELLPFHHLSAGSLSPISKKNLEKRKHLLDCLYSIVTYQEGSASEEQAPVEKPTHFPRAVELHNCGVHFKALGSGNMNSVWFDKKKATLHVPKVRVGDDTERLLRNLIAYESHLVDNVHVLSYLRFMNSLVDGPDDVALLVEKGVIEQDIGSNEEVADMWNNLSVNTMRVCSSEYEEVARELLVHCQHRLNALKAEFKRDYLSRPWLVVSVVSAGALLLMTFIITVYTIELYYNG